MMGLNLQKNRFRAASSTLIIFSCFSFLVFAAALWWLYSSAKFKPFSADSVKDIKLDKELDFLRGKIQQLKHQWDSGERKEQLLEQLQAIKKRLEKIKEQSSTVVQKRIQDLIDSTEDLMARIKREVGNIGEKFDTLAKGLEQLLKERAKEGSPKSVIEEERKDDTENKD